MYFFHFPKQLLVLQYSNISSKQNSLLSLIIVIQKD